MKKKIHTHASPTLHNPAKRPETISKHDKFNIFIIH